MRPLLFLIYVSADAIYSLMTVRGPSVTVTPKRRLRSRWWESSSNPGGK